MRVTNNMITNTVAFNTHRAIARFLEMQTQMSSGRRINNPSDDPVGTIRDLDYRAELSKNLQYRGAIDQALNWMGSYENDLDDINSMLSSARELAVAMSNGTYDDEARQASANEVKSILDRIMQLSADELEGKSIFGGFRTHVRPIQLSSTGARYMGDTGNIEFQIDSASKLPVNLIGSEVFLKAVTILGEKADLNVAITGATLLANLDGGNGISLPAGTIRIDDLNLGLSSTVDLSTATTINDIINLVNAQLAVDGITNLTAALGQEGNNIKFITSQNGLISNQTSVSRLNNGSGIQLAPGQFTVTDGAGTNVQINASNVATIGDVIVAFNTQLSLAGINNVTMQINAAGTGLEINDTNGVPLGLRIEEVSTHSTIANGLGIIGPINPQLIGQDLRPVVSFNITDTVGNTAAQLGIRDSFTSDLVGNDLNPILTVSSLVSDFNNGNGLAIGELIIKQGEKSRVIDLGDPLIVTVQDMLDAINNAGLAITASINADSSGLQIVNNDPNRSLIVEEVSSGKTAKNLGLFGGADLMGTVMILLNALENNDQAGTGLLLEHIDNSLQHLLNQRATVGARSLRLESTHSRLVSQDLNFTKLLSDVEDADLSKVLTELATFENNYQAALMASARIVQPSLLDFMK